MSNYQLFSCGTDAMVWQEHNCEQCAKAIFEGVNYKCDIQREIELAWCGTGCGSKAAHDATQQRVCPNFKPIER